MLKLVIVTHHSANESDPTRGFKTNDVILLRDIFTDMQIFLQMVPDAVSASYNARFQDSYQDDAVDSIIRAR